MQERIEKPFIPRIYTDEYWLQLEKRIIRVSIATTGLVAEIEILRKEANGADDSSCFYIPDHKG